MRLLSHVAGLAFLAVPFACLGAAFTAHSVPSCTVVEVTPGATLIDWRDVKAEAERQARANGCATIQTVRG